MNIKILYYWGCFILLLGLTAACSSESSSTNNAAGEAIVLNEFQTVISREDTLMGMPVMLKYEESTDHLFVYDINQRKVFEMDSRGSEIAEYGGKGRGPGELLSLGNFFVTDNYVYILDPQQFFIQKYNRSGEVVSTLDYSKLLVKEDTDSHRPPPPQPVLNDVNNKPFVTLNGNLLIPIYRQGESLFKLVTWEGTHLANIGEIPEPYLTSAGEEQTKAAYENREVPARDMYRAFPVNDPANPGELFIVYSAIPKIAKYDTSGQKLWERAVPDTPELDALAGQYYNYAEERPGVFKPIIKYVFGMAGPAGDLYVGAMTGALLPGEFPLWMHYFNASGELLNRYKIAADSTLWYYPAVDVSGRRIFVAPQNDVVVESYSF